jgi:hypothetical protein
MCIGPHNSFWLLSYTPQAKNSLQIMVILCNHIMHTHSKMLPLEKGDNMFEIIMVGLLPTGNRHFCVCHPFGCDNTLVLE